MRLLKSEINEDVARVVEGQSYISTRQLVDSNAEQEMLEQMLDASKPPYPDIDGINSLNYLLKTPFRYPPLPYGSRFGGRNEPGIFYGSIELVTALCEAAYYRFRFLLDSEAELRPSFIQHTSFLVALTSKAALNLKKGKWQELESKISSTTSYKFSQEIGSKARDSSIEVILYHSARAEKGTNVAVFTPEVFVSKKVKNLQHWNAYVDYTTITFTHNEGKESFSFPIEKFMVKGIFPKVPS